MTSWGRDEKVASQPAGSEPIRILVFYTPGGIDKFFTEVGEPAERHELPPPSQSPPDLERIAAIGEKYGMHIKAPAPR